MLQSIRGKLTHLPNGPLNEVLMKSTAISLMKVHAESLGMNKKNHLLNHEKFKTPPFTECCFAAHSIAKCQCRSTGL